MVWEVGNYNSHPTGPAFDFELLHAGFQRLLEEAAGVEVGQGSNGEDVAPKDGEPSPEAGLQHVFTCACGSARTHGSYVRRGTQSGCSPACTRGPAGSA
jgi:hypothetical protein